MGFLRIIFGIWAGWLAIRIAKSFLLGQIGQKTEEQKIKPDSNMLELVPCPYCGVFTTTPCTNPDCPGKSI